MTSMIYRDGWANDGQVHLSVQKGGPIVPWLVAPASYSARCPNLTTTTSTQISSAQHSNTTQVSYHRRHDIPAVSSGRWMAGGVLCSRKAAPLFLLTRTPLPQRPFFHALFYLGSYPRSSAEGLQQSPD